jgi:hypothetical protein
LVVIVLSIAVIVTTFLAAASGTALAEAISSLAAPVPEGIDAS